MVYTRQTKWHYAPVKGCQCISSSPCVRTSEFPSSFYMYNATQPLVLRSGQLMHFVDEGECIRLQEISSISAEAVPQGLWCPMFSLEWRAHPHLFKNEDRVHRFTSFLAVGRSKNSISSFWLLRIKIHKWTLWSAVV